MKLSIRTLEDIPGVGKSIANDLRDLGIEQPGDLKGKNPERLYEKLCALRGHNIDRCMLYTFRCAVYAVSVTRHDPKKLQWWHWKDSEK
ncbi:MAG: pathogenicity locus [Candidatus Moranbacteria bacterium]|nr:pathogenicity locus [Candidatus Moranbacteria bacterium]